MRAIAGHYLNLSEGTNWLLCHRMNSNLVVHFERTAYCRFMAASLALRSFTNARSGDSNELVAYLRTLEARAAHEERRYRRWLRYRFAVMCTAPNAHWRLARPVLGSEPL